MAKNGRLQTLKEKNDEVKELEEGTEMAQTYFKLRNWGQRRLSLTLSTNNSEITTSL